MISHKLKHIFNVVHFFLIMYVHACRWSNRLTRAALFSLIQLSSLVEIYIHLLLMQALYTTAHTSTPNTPLQPTPSCFTSSDQTDSLPSPVYLNPTMVLKMHVL